MDNKALVLALLVLIRLSASFVSTRTMEDNANIRIMIKLITIKLMIRANPFLFCVLGNLLNLNKYTVFEAFISLWILEWDKNSYTKLAVT